MYTKYGLSETLDIEERRSRYETAFKTLVAGGGFEPPIPLGGIMPPLTIKPLRIKACLGKKSFSTFLGFQIILSFLGCPVIGMLFGENESPRPISLGPALESSCIVLLFSDGWIIADSDIKAATRNTPEYVHKIRLV
jgi:hypothetical protein